jgi:hypothetical protein
MIAAVPAGELVPADRDHWLRGGTKWASGSAEIGVARGLARPPKMAVRAGGSPSRLYDDPREASGS